LSAFGYFFLEIQDESSEGTFNTVDLLSSKWVADRSLISVSLAFFEFRVKLFKTLSVSLVQCLVLFSKASYLDLDFFQIHLLEVSINLRVVDSLINLLVSLKLHGFFGRLIRVDLDCMGCCQQQKQQNWLSHIFNLL